MERTKITVRKLFKQIPVRVIKGLKDVEITGVTANSKQVAPGFLFIAKKGLTVDGAEFIQDAIEAGAVAILSDLYNPFLSVTQVIHKDVASIERAVAESFYNNPVEDLFLVGITGTNGKTTTSYLVKHLLEEVKHPSGLIGTVQFVVGSHILPSTHTTPDLLQLYKLFAEMRGAQCSSCVMEVSSHALHQGRVRGIEFDVALFTNLTQDHLDYHQTMQEYASAKALLFSSLKPGKKPFEKVAVVNADCPFSALMLKECAARALSYGIDHPCDVKASSLKLSATGLSFTVTFQEQSQLFQSTLIGRYNLYNLLGAIAVGLVRGLSLKEMAEKLKKGVNVPGRLESIPNQKGIHIFVDYAHTDDALANVLTTLQEIKQQGRLITVFGCGGNRDPYKRPKMGAVVEKLSDLAIVTSDNPRQESPEEIIRQILSGLKLPSMALVIPDRQEAIERAIHLAKPGDLVLIAGKGHERQQIFSNQVIDFDDRAVALAATCSTRL